MPKNSCIMQIWAESGKSALPICNYSQILYQFLTFTQNLKRSLGVLFYGDSSLLIAILKFVGGAILVFGIMAIVAYCPWLLLVVIAVALFVVWACSNNNSQGNNTNNSNSSLNNTNTQPIQKNIEEKPINNPNLTGFKAELQENTLTPQQASDEQWEKDKRCIDYDVDRAYENIKSNLLRQARNGDYSVSMVKEE